MELRSSQLLAQQCSDFSSPSLTADFSVLGSLVDNPAEISGILARNALMVLITEEKGSRAS